MNIRIIGGIGSGKTYLAKRLSKDLGFVHVHLDDFVWDNDADDYFAKRKPVVRDRLLKKALKKKRWVVEGVYCMPWTKQSFTQADLVIYLRSSFLKRYWRVFRRFFLGKLGKVYCPEKSLLDVIRIIRLDRDWTKQVERAGASVRRFRKADDAFDYIASLQK